MRHLIELPDELASCVDVCNAITEYVKESKPSVDSQFRALELKSRVWGLAWFSYCVAICLSACSRCLCFVSVPKA